MRACRLSVTSSLVAIGSSFDHVVCDGSGRATSAVLATRLAAESEIFNMGCLRVGSPQPLMRVLPSAIVALPRTSLALRRMARFLASRPPKSTDGTSCLKLFDR